MWVEAVCFQYLSESVRLLERSIKTPGNNYISVSGPKYTRLHHNLAKCLWFATPFWIVDIIFFRLRRYLPSTSKVVRNATYSMICGHPRACRCRASQAL